MYAYVRDGHVRFVADGDSAGETSKVSIEVFQMDNPEMQGEGEVTLVTSIDHFRIRISPDTVYHGKKAKVEIVPKDNHDQTRKLADDVLLKITLDEKGARYGTLLAGGMEEKTFESISYGIVRDKKLEYIANGDNPIGSECCAPEIKITISLQSDQKVNGDGNARVHCKNKTLRYAQGGTTSWADSVYDHASGNEKEIKWKGCALSCMAMAMTALGDTVNSGELNTWMKSKNTFKEGAYSGQKVNWNAIELHSSDVSLKKTYMKNKHWHDTQQTTDLSVVDNALKKCKLIIAQVYNDESSRTGQHWVLITGKENDDYKILDPAGREEDTLSEYDDNIWSYVIIQKQ